MRSCKGCDAKDAHIASLMEQIEWLRVHNGTPTPIPFTVPGPLDEPAPWETATWLSEEEEEIEAMRQAKLITASDAAAALAQVGAFNTEVNIEG